MNNSVLKFKYAREDIQIAQLQVFVSAVIAMLKGSWCSVYASKFFVPFPQTFSTWEEVYQYVFRVHNVKEIVVFWGSKVVKYNKDNFFYQLDALLYLRLVELQNDFDNLQSLNIVASEPEIIKQQVDRLVGAYISINNDITLYFIRLAQVLAQFNMRNKYRPTYINLDWLRMLNGAAIEVALSKDKGTYQNSFKALLAEFACLCRYLSFFICLLQILSYPILSFKLRMVIASLVCCLKNNFSYVFVHYILVESSSVTSVPAALRGANDKTTRIKVYFTLEDGIPALARLDLPHKGEPFFHINVESASTYLNKFNHMQLCKVHDDINIIEPLEQSLMTFNYKGLKYEKMSKDNDAALLHSVAVERALYGAAHVEFMKATLCGLSGDESEKRDSNLNDNISDEAKSYFKQCYDTLKNEAENLHLSKTNNTELFNKIFNEYFYDH